MLYDIQYLQILSIFSSIITMIIGIKTADKKCISIGFFTASGIFTFYFAALSDILR